MSLSQDASLDLDAAVKTVVCSGNEQVPTFVANEFWQAVSVTNGEKPTPSNPDNEAVYQPS